MARRDRIRRWLGAVDRDLRDGRRSRSRPIGYTGKHAPHLLAMGRCSYGDPTVLCVKDNGSAVTVGAFCSIADDVTFLVGGGHRIDQVTTCPHLLGGADPHHPPAYGDISVGNDVWIGRGTTILEGVTIGTGAVIGAQAVVAKDVRAYDVVAGNPARVLRRRFPDDLAERLLASEWWTWPDDRLKAAMPLLWSSDIEAFLARA